MSETPTRFALEAADDLLLYPGRATLATIDKHLAAAEERGRRRGVEEAAKLCITESETFHTGFYFANGIRAIAPAPGCVEERDELQAGMLRLLRDGYGPGGGFYEPDQRLAAAVALLDVGWDIAPRDSGKEPVRDSDDDLRALGERWTGKDRK